MRAKDKRGKIRWRGAFFEALQLELHEYAKWLDSRNEHHLSKEALIADAVVLKKEPRVRAARQNPQGFRDDFPRPQPVRVQIGNLEAFLEMEDGEMSQIMKETREAFFILAQRHGWDREFVLIGEQKGEQRGIQIGEQRGIRIGEERIKNLLSRAIAKNLKDEGLPLGAIARSTGLTAGEIEAL